MLHDGDETPIGGHISHIRGVEALEKAIQLSGYHKPKPKNVGRGLSFSEWSPSGGEGNVFVTIDEEGTVKVSTPVVDQGAGVLTVIVEVVGEELQVPADEIELTQLDSSVVPSDGGVGGSRATRVYGNAAYEAGTKARAEILAVVAEKLAAKPEELELNNGRVVHRESKRKMSFAEIVKAQGIADQCAGLLQERGKIPRCFDLGANSRSPCGSGDWPGHLAQMTSAHTTGKVINPLMHQGQIEGGVVFGLGYALTEEVMFDGGRVTTTNFGEFKIPNIRDIPPLKTAVMETVPAWTRSLQ